MQTTLLTQDLNHILQKTLSLWETLRNQRIFITGGTGFFGCWLLESFLWANKQLSLNATATVLTRNQAAFAKKCPHLTNDPALHFHEGDIKNFIFPKTPFSHLIHAATEANYESPDLLDTIVQGTQHVLEFAKYCGAKRVLFISSGAVYGKQPPHITHLAEDNSLPENLSPYAQGKRQGEQLCALYAKQVGFEVKIARCFAFVGPYLPLDRHFAIGNFIRDGLNGGPIQVNSDGSAYRSYLYAADLAIWLWTILILGKSLRPYNVGSADAYTIADIAHLVAHSVVKVTIAHPPSPNILPERYVPDITRAHKELGLSPTIRLIDAIHATQRWYSNG